MHIFEDIIAENIPNLGKETVTQIQEVQRVPYRINPQKTTPKHSISKMTLKKRLKRSKEKK